MKVCSVCKIEKTEDQFGAHKGRKDGKSDWYGDWCTVIRQSECGKWDNELKILKDKIKENVQ